MRKNDPRYNSWHKRYSLRRWFHELDRRYLKQRKRSGKNLDRKEARFVLPSNFSLLDNFEAVVEKFKKIKNKILSPDFTSKTVYLDMKDVTHVTVDALMYLLVFIKNLKEQIVSFESIRGNLPSNEDCSKIVKQSGFLKYLQTNARSEFSRDNVQIYAGDQIDGEKIAEVCSFVQGKFGSGMIGTKKLYGSLGEIIGNSNEHAYEGEKQWKQWIVYAEHVDSIIKVVVLDTGAGIIKTMKKKGIFEKIDFISDHVFLLKSALEGNYRSKTKLSYRNKGLPSLRKKALDNILKNLVLFSNDVKYSCTYENNDTKENCELLNNSLEGTLYYFEYLPEVNL